MADDRFKDDLHHYLQQAREAVLWKLEGASEYDVRRPLVPTGTNLLGLVKHLAMVDSGYFGDTFGRPLADRPAYWDDEATFNGDMYATAGESRTDIVDLYRRVWAHSDATIAALPLDAIGQVPWWPAGSRAVTLHRVLVHMIAETSRHAGHADIVRELIDGAAGHRAANANMSPPDAAEWSGYRDRLERIARDAGDRDSSKP
jgi:uncharacterized damage-inducible protein DinB